MWTTGTIAKNRAPSWRDALHLYLSSTHLYNCGTLVHTVYHKKSAYVLHFVVFCGGKVPEHMCMCFEFLCDKLTTQGISAPFLWFPQFAVACHTRCSFDLFEDDKVPRYVYKITIVRSPFYAVRGSISTSSIHVWTAVAIIPILSLQPFQLLQTYFRGTLYRGRKTTSSHCLNQCWLISNAVLCHSPESNYTGKAQDMYPWYQFESY